MSKVFIQLDWKAFRKLSASLQQAWFYGWTNCDSAGVFEFDEDYAKVDLGRKVTEKDFMQLESYGVKKIDENKFLFTEFILVNYVNLKPDYNPHKPAFRALEKHNLILNDKKNYVDFKLHPSLPQASSKLEDEDKEEDKGKDEEEGKDKPSGQLFEKTLSFPWESKEFKKAWEAWKSYKKGQHKFVYKAMETEQAALNTLAKMANGIEIDAIEIINHTIGNGWKGFVVPDKKKNNGTYQQTPTTNGFAHTGRNGKDAGINELLESAGKDLQTIQRRSQGD